MLKDKREAVWSIIITVVAMVLFLGIISSLASCRQPLEFHNTTVKRDTSWSVRTIHSRDTVVYMPADSAVLKIVADVVAFRRLLEEIKANGDRKVVQGSRNAQLVMSLRNDTLDITAMCDSLDTLLTGAYTTITDQSYTISEQERVINILQTDNDSKAPGWVEGTLAIITRIMMLVALIGLVVLLKPLLKRS